MIRSFVKKERNLYHQGLIDALHLDECGSDQSQEQTKSSYFEFNEYELSLRHQKRVIICLITSRLNWLKEQ